MLDITETGTRRRQVVVEDMDLDMDFDDGSTTAAALGKRSATMENPTASSGIDSALVYLASFVRLYGLHDRKWVIHDDSVGAELAALVSHTLPTYSPNLGRVHCC